MIFAHLKTVELQYIYFFLTLVLRVINLVPCRFSLGIRCKPFIKKNV